MQPVIFLRKRGRGETRRMRQSPEVRYAMKWEEFAFLSVWIVCYLLWSLSKEDFEMNVDQQRVMDLLNACMAGKCVRGKVTRWSE